MEKYGLFYNKTFFGLDFKIQLQISNIIKAVLILQKYTPYFRCLLMKKPYTSIFQN